MNGLDLLRKVRADDQLRKTPFLMTSGDGNPYALVAAKHSGLDNFILKPFTPAALSEKLRSVLGVAAG
jgi:two-component system chemotaxis response regulator CheY